MLFQCTAQLLRRLGGAEALEHNATPLCLGVMGLYGALGLATMPAALVIIRESHGFVEAVLGRFICGLMCLVERYLKEPHVRPSMQARAAAVPPKCCHNRQLFAAATTPPLPSSA
jgi:hypothetical protein